MASVDNKLRLTAVDGSGSKIQTTYLYKIPAGDFDVQVTISNFAFNGSDGDDRLKASLGITNSNKHNEEATGFTVSAYPRENTALVDVLCHRYLDGSSSSGSWDYDIGSFTTLTLRLIRVGNTVYGYYQKDAGAWILSWSATHDDMLLPDRIILTLREYNGGNDGGSVDFDNLIFNKAQCPTGDQWTTTTTTTITTTSTSSCSTLSTHSITTTTEPPG